MPEFIAAIDVGTTSTRCLIFDEGASIIASHQLEIAPFQKLYLDKADLKRAVYPKPGWFEERLDDFISHSQECVSLAVERFEKAGHAKSDIKGIGITNQRETICVWRKSTGEPLHNAIVWPDTRNTATVKQLAQKSDKGLDVLRAKTGLPLSTYFAAVKLRWLLDNNETVRKAHEDDDLYFGTVDSWMLWKLTGGKNGGKFLTDVTNASRTMLMDVKKLAWDEEALAFFGIRRSCLAEIVSCSEVYGELADGALKGLKIAGLIGDQQAALVGQKCLSVGMSKNTYGTGCFLLYNTGEEVVPSKHGLLTTVAYQLGRNATPHYALEGSIAVGGSSIQWLRDQLNLIKDAKEIGTLAAEVDDTGGLYFVPAFSGLFAPYWDDTAAGLMIGLSSYTTKKHIARATLEAVCYQTKAILEAMQKDAGSNLAGLRVDGGMSNSDECMQIQADIIGIEVDRPDMRESTALGSALCAGAALGLFGWKLNQPKTVEQVNKKGQKLFKPKWTDEARKEKYAGWERAVERSRSWNV